MKKTRGRKSRETVSLIFLNLVIVVNFSIFVSQVTVASIHSELIWAITVDFPQLPVPYFPSSAP
jgi:hypothetical protein